MTKLLAIDSSGTTASVAVLEDDMLLAEYTVNDGKTHSETLMPMIDTVFGMLGMQASELDAIAISKGPGSFTGLRIGAATAKGLGMALEIPLIPVPTVDALAYNLFGATENRIVPLMDARRGQVYTGFYQFRDGRMETLREQWATEIDVVIDLVNGGPGEGAQDGVSAEGSVLPTIFLGDGVPVFREKLESEVHVPIFFAPAHMDRQRAASVGALGMRLFREGKTVSAAEFVPEYLRLSQAERERLEREQAERQRCESEPLESDRQIESGEARG